MKKDRYIFALIIYGIVLLASAGICSYAFPGDVSVAVNAGESLVEPDTSGTTKPTSALAVQSPTAPPVNPTLPAQPDDSMQGEGEAQPNPSDADPWELMTAATTKEWREVIGNRCIVIPKPEAAVPEQEIIFLSAERPIDRSIDLEFQGCSFKKYEYEELERIANGSYFATEPLADSGDPLEEILQLSTVQEDGSCHIYLELLLDKTYAYSVYETESYYFVALNDAKKAHEKIVVLDAGHGGWDTGTPSADGQYFEKDINLQVLLYLEELLKQEDIKVYLTRTEDHNVNQKDRIRLANDLCADMFISIHCNNAYQNPDVQGTEVLYTQYQDGQEGLNSKKLARICQEELVKELQLQDRGLVANGEELTVLQEAEVPAAVVELAFMSSPNDMEALKDEETLRSAAKALYQAILRAYEGT